VANYHLLTTWRIEAPLETVYAAVRDSRRWPDWWPGVVKVEQTADGEVDGIHSVWRYWWRGKLPYRVAFEVCVTRIERLVAIEGTTRGDLEGVGRWNFSQDGPISVVRCEWQVRSTRLWMNLIAPFARSMFIRNHAQVMAQGAEGLARLLNSPLVSQESIDLADRAASQPPGFRPSRQRGSVDAQMIFVAGISAGVIVTLVQLVLWWLVGMPLPETLFRDVRLTAALVMGPAVLPPPSTLQWDVLLAAILIHFVLSFGYAVVPASLFRHLRPRTNLFAGGLYGIAIYTVNLYLLAAVFPWFAVARDWVTLIAHVVFGVALAETCRLFAQNSAEPSVRAQPCIEARRG
jgi:uncharacterized protein YndB with AHSA1/START domain